MDLVLAHHHHTQRAHGRQGPFERVDEVVVQIQKYQARDVGQVRDLGNQIVLIVQKPQSAVSLWRMMKKNEKGKKGAVSFGKVSSTTRIQVFFPSSILHKTELAAKTNNKCIDRTNKYF